MREALEFAIAHTKEPGKYSFSNLYKCGLNGYDLWIKALDMDKGRVSAGGMAYNIQVWGECRQNAFAFLKEAKERINSSNQALFDGAIGYFEVVAQEFGKLRQLFEFRPNDFKITITDKQLLSDASQSLQKAREAEAGALVEFEGIVAAL